MGNQLWGGGKYTILPNFPKTAGNLKNLDAGGGGVAGSTFDPPMVLLVLNQSFLPIMNLLHIPKDLTHPAGTSPNSAFFEDIIILNI